MSKKSLKSMSARHIEEDSQDESQTMDPEQHSKMMTKVVSRMRNYPLIKKVKSMVKMISVSANSVKKLIVRSFYLGNRESFTISLSFDSYTYTFELQALSWENPNHIVRARLGLDTFFRMFKYKRILVDRKMSGITMKESMGDNLNKVLEKLLIETDSKRGIDRLRLDWDEDTRDESTEDASNNQE